MNEYTDFYNDWVDKALSKSIASSWQDYVNGKPDVNDCEIDVSGTGEMTSSELTDLINQMMQDALLAPNFYPISEPEPVQEPTITFILFDQEIVTHEDHEEFLLLYIPMIETHGLKYWKSLMNQPVITKHLDEETITAINRVVTMKFYLDSVTEQEDGI